MTLVKMSLYCILNMKKKKMKAFKTIKKEKTLLQFSKEEDTL